MPETTEPQIIKLKLTPGINRESTDYANTGGYYDCSLARVVSGAWQSVGGWQRFINTIALGTYRSLFPFSTLDGTKFYGAGTNLKYYLIRGQDLVDITPIRSTSTIDNNPFTVTLGSTTVLVEDTAHGAVMGDFVTFSGAAAVGGVPAGDFNQEHQITGNFNANAYYITVATAGTSSASGGGAVVVAAYQINSGLNTTLLSNGWGAGPWGGTDGTGWGEGADTSVTSMQLRLWSEDNFGEDLLYNVRNGGIYYKDTTIYSDRGVNITTLGDGPSVATQILVSDNDRHVLAFGANPYTSSVQDPLLLRWSDSENIAVWTPDTVNSAGSMRFDGGSRFVRAVETTTEIVVFTDATLHSLRFIGSPYFFGQVRIGTNIQLIGPNAAASTGAEVYWMAKRLFQMYDGVVRDLDCTVHDYIFGILNEAQAEKIVAGINREYGEVTWHIPVNGSSENNFYVTYNYIEKRWYYGAYNGEGRTAWVDAWYESVPLACSPDGYIYLHDTGAVDGSVSPAEMLDSFLESSVVELGFGENFAYISRFIPDYGFAGSTVASPQVTVTFTKRDYPGSAFVTGPTASVTRSVSTPVEEYTTKRDIRFRARSVQYRVETSATGTLWQQGTPRLYASPDGQR